MKLSDEIEDEGEEISSSSEKEKKLKKKKPFSNRRNFANYSESNSNSHSKNNQIQVDISIGHPEGILSTNIIKETIKKKPLIKYSLLFIKHLLKVYKLNETFKGGMSSYLLYHLVLFYFQKVYNEEMKKIGISLNDNNFNDSVLNLGYFLKGFFKFYSKDFDNSCQGISIKNGGNFLNNIENGYGEIYVENVINKKENIFYLTF